MFAELIQILMNSVSVLLGAFIWLFKLNIGMFSCNIFGIQEYEWRVITLLELLYDYCRQMRNSLYLNGGVYILF